MILAVVFLSYSDRYKVLLQDRQEPMPIFVTTEDNSSSARFSQPAHYGLKQVNSLAYAESCITARSANRKIKTHVPLVPLISDHLKYR